MAKKDLIIKNFKRNPFYKDTELAKKFKVTPQYVGKVLDSYKEDITDKVIALFFIEHKKINEISYIVLKSVPTIRKILRLNMEDYNKELYERKIKSDEKSKCCKRKYMADKRAENAEDRNTINELLRLQSLNAKEMSLNHKFYIDDEIYKTYYEKYDPIPISIVEQTPTMSYNIIKTLEKAK